MAVQLVRKVRDMQLQAERWRQEGRLVGLVPTMGYLHEGHLSLIRIARERSDVVVTSIFVNPTQFAPHEDYQRYPRDLPRDMALAEQAGCDVIFHPSVEEMYPAGYLTYVEVEKITGVLCGRSRPTHFRGVTTVVAKLFNIVKPHVAVFGQKDAQQALVVRRMAQDLNFDLEIVVAPIVREPDGLAMSSRNSYLSPEERRQAVVLSKALQRASELVAAGERSAARLVMEMEAVIRTAPSARVDYVAVVDAQTLEEVEQLRGQVLIALAVWIGSTRLIDNVMVEV
ncbi:MAG: pantoate--beta-alanine ligase [bacterium]|nr:pantoate--beta-alanine ligase [candidate division KSB1 bacterium]MDH7559820.1 pantoate--beta-alanine ligase [bacterium]